MISPPEAKEATATTPLRMENGYVKVELRQGSILVYNGDRVVLQIIPDSDYIGVHQWDEAIKVFYEEGASITMKPRNVIMIKKVA